MSTAKQELPKLQGITESGERATIFYLLKARVASGLENKEPGFEQIPDSMGQVWNDAAANIDRLTETDPQRALKLGLTISLLPRGSEREDVYRWMRGDGPLILAKDDLREPLLDYFSSNNGASQLVLKLEEYMDFDLSGLTRDQVFDQPDCFLAVACLYLGTKLSHPENERAIKLRQLAITRLSDPAVSKVVRFYREFEDTAWLVDELDPFLAQ